MNSYNQALAIGLVIQDVNVIKGSSRKLTDFPVNLQTLILLGVASLIWVMTAQAVTQIKPVINQARMPESVQSQSFYQPAGDVSAPARGQQLDAGDSGDSNAFWWFLFQRWTVFCAVVLLLMRRVWRYFHEVEDDDDFADHLSTLAVAYRWIFPVYLALLMVVAVAELFQMGNLFCSLSILALASSIRRYYCDGDFADHPLPQKIHFAMRLLLICLGWAQGYDNYLSLPATWFHWHVFVWLALALTTMVFSQFYNNHDLAAHRRELGFFLGGFLILGIVGGAAGSLAWVKGRYDGSPWPAFFALGVLACFPLALFFYRWSKQVSEGYVGRLLFDMIFSEGDFAEKIRKQRHLPELLMLQHWRGRGEVEKAWQIAKRHLFKEVRALPVWLFALETGVLYRRKPGAALKILKRLCNTDEFTYDHRTVAVAQMQGWMAAAGFSFDAARFKIEKPVLQPALLMDRVEQKCRKGRFGEAEMILKEVLDKDSQNEPAFIQLVRLYCQDLKNRPAAERLIAGARDTFSPSLLDFLGRTLDEWMKLPIRSVVKRKKFLQWLWPKKLAQAGSGKISTVSSANTAKSNTTIVREAHS
jgi:hypothetical protein